MNSKVFQILVVLFLSSIVVNAQFNLGDKIKEKIKERAEQKVDQKIDQGLDAAEKKAEGEDEEAVEEKPVKEKSSKSQIKKAKTEEVSESEESDAQQEKKSPLKANSKYDFVPGDKIIFYDDFADVAIGDFPMNWETTSSGEVVTLDNMPGKWFQLNGEYSYYAPIFKNLIFPENFTIEFDAVCLDDQDFSLEIFENDEKQINNNYYPGKGGTYIAFESSWLDWKTWKANEDNVPQGESAKAEFGIQKKLHYSIWGQKSRLRVYCNEQKILDLPRGVKNEMKLNYLRFGNYGQKMYVSNLRVAIGAPDMRSRLITEGKFVTNGITFDSGSDKIKPESSSVLKEIADVLKENPGVKVKIIGHTDSDGNDASNMTLSKKRAAAVKNALSESFGIDVSRMTTDGKGESEPVAKNDTAQGKASNRRVEFVKQ